jgi:spore germination protein GerM
MLQRKRIELTVALVVALLLGACGPTAAPTAVPTGAVTAVPVLAVTVYFGNTERNPGLLDCSKVYPVERTTLPPSDVPKAVLEQLFLGPTPAEKDQGYVSAFSSETADILIDVKVQDRTAYVNLKDIRAIIPNASTSCGSAAFFAEVGTTVKGSADVDRVLYAIEGDPRPFWEWMQIGCAPENDNCDPAPFQDDTQ